MERARRRQASCQEVQQASFLLCAGVRAVTLASAQVSELQPGLFFFFFFLYVSQADRTSIPLMYYTVV